MISLYSKRYPEHRGYKLTSLDPEFITLLQTALEQYENTHQLFFDLQLTPKSEYRDRLQEICEMNGAEGIHAALQMTKRMGSEHEALSQQRQRRKWARALTPELYARLAGAIQSPLAKARIEEMDQRWQQQGNFSYFGDRALMRAYYQLQGVEVLIKFALEELDSRYKKRSWFSKTIPEHVYAEYHQYLKQAQSVIELEKQQITSSMYERLRVAANEQDITSSDVLIRTFRQLQQFGALKQGFASTAKRERALSSDLFTQFHKAIFADASFNVRRKTLQLPWFSPFRRVETREEALTTISIEKVENLSTLTLKQHTARLFQLESAVPAKATFPKWLFKGRNLRYEFFNNTHAWASFATARDRLSESIEGCWNAAGFDALIFELSNINGSLLSFEEKATVALEKVNKGLWRFFSKKSRRFLADYQRVLLFLRAKQETQLQQLLQRWVRSLDEDLLIPDSKFIQTLESMRKIELTQTKSLQEKFFEIDEAIARARVRQDGARALAERVARAKALVLPLQTQSVQAPATVESVEAILEAYNALTVHDAEAEVVIDGIDTCLKMLKTEAELPEVTSNFDEQAQQVFIAHYQYLNNLSKTAMIAGQNIDRQQVANLTEDVMCQYLRAFSDDDYAASLTDDSRWTITNTQAHLLQNCGDESIQSLTRQCQELQEEGRFEELNILATRYLRKYEKNIIERHCAKYFIALEKSIFQHLKSKHRLKLTSDQMRHISVLCTRMANNRCRDVRVFSDLTATDKAFLGLGNGLMNRLFGQRKILQAAINIIAGVRLSTRRLPYATTKKQQNTIIQQLKSEVQTQIQLYGNQELAKIMGAKRFFSADDILAQKNTMNEVPVLAHTEHRLSERSQLGRGQ